MTQELEAVVLSVKPGDILFVDADAIDFDMLSEFLRAHPEMAPCAIIPVMVRHGMTVKDHLAIVAKEEISKTQEMTQNE